MEHGVEIRRDQEFHLAVPIEHQDSEDVKADVMKRIAAPMIGGMVSSTVLTLLVIPILYALWRGRSLPAVDWQLDTSAHPTAQSDQS